MKNQGTTGPKNGPEKDGDPTVAYLNSRINYLDRLNKNALAAMENVAKLGDFKDSFSQIANINVILEKISEGCSNTVPLSACYTFLIDDQNEFVLQFAQGETKSFAVQKELDNIIETRKLAQSILHKKPLRHKSTQGFELILHIIATSSRVRGLFVGVLEEPFKNIPDYALSVLKILMLSGANCIENYELYQTLQDKISKLEESEKQLSIQAFHDSLTQLPNRFFFDAETKRRDKKKLQETAAEFRPAHAGSGQFQAHQRFHGPPDGGRTLEKSCRQTDRSLARIRYRGPTGRR